MADNERNKSIFETIFVPVIIALLTAGTAPFWLQMLLDSSTTSPPKPGTTTSYVEVRNKSQWVGQGRWNWTVYVVADTYTMSKINCVEYTLDSSFPNPVRTICQPNNSFALSGNGWGVFNIPIKVFFKDGSVKNLNHRLSFN